MKHIRAVQAEVPTTVAAVLSACETNGGACSISRDHLAKATLAEAGDCMDALDRAFEQGLIIATSKPDTIEIMMLPGAIEAFNKLTG